MATQKLLDELAEKEAEATKKRLAATAQVYEIEQRVQDRMKELACAQRARAQAEREREAANDRRIHDAENKARERVAEAEQARCLAKRLAEDAERHADAVRGSQKVAERSLETLRPLAQKRIAIAEHGTAEAMKVAQAHVGTADKEAKERLESFTAQADALQAEAAKKQADLQHAAMEQVSLAEDRAATRARSRELCGLTRARDHMLTSPHDYVSGDTAKSLMTSTVGEWSKHPGRQWPWKQVSGPTAMELDCTPGGDVHFSSMRYHPICLGSPWLGSDEPKSQTYNGPSRQMGRDEHIKTPLRPTRLPFGEHVSKFQGFGSFGVDSSKRKTPSSAR